MWKIFLAVLLIGWGYRQIGVLRYKIKNVNVNYSLSGVGSVSFPSVPNLGRYLIWKYLTRTIVRWNPPSIFWFLDKKRSDYARLLRCYKKIYFWPIDVWKEIHSNWRYGSYAFYAVLRKQA